MVILTYLCGTLPWRSGRPTSWVVTPSCRADHPCQPPYLHVSSCMCRACLFSRPIAFSRPQPSDSGPTRLIVTPIARRAAWSVMSQLPHGLLPPSSWLTAPPNALLLMSTCHFGTSRDSASIGTTLGSDRWGQVGHFPNFPKRRKDPLSYHHTDQAFFWVLFRV